MSTRCVDAGIMHGFKVINIFPESCSEEDWTEFADAMSKIIKETDADDLALH